jgi:MoxR-like ATPase
MSDPLITYTPDNLPEIKKAVSLQQKAAFMVAVAQIKGDSTTPSDTPILGATELDKAKSLIESHMNIPMANPHAVINRYSEGTPYNAPVKATSHTDTTTYEAVTGTPDETLTVAPSTTDDEEPPEMSITGMLDTIKDTPSIPLAIVGDAGTGKTSIIRQWAIDNGYEMNLFLANTASEDDVAGAITPDHEKKMAVAYPLEKLHRSTTHKTVLFLDELNTARREVQDPLLTLIQDRCLPNGTPLHPETVIVTAINPSATYNNHEMSPQLRNRFMWYYHNPSEYDWTQWVGTTELGATPAGKHLEAMVLDGTLKFDKDEAFTDERNEFTTPRSLYNLLKVSRGSVSRLKALAENLVAPSTAEAIRLHGYNDKDSRGNSFFEERKKVNPNDGMIIDEAANIDPNKLKEFMEKGLGLTYPKTTAEVLSNLPTANVYKQEYDADKIKAEMSGAYDALGGTSSDSTATETDLQAEIAKRLSQYRTN